MKEEAVMGVRILDTDYSLDANVVKAKVATLRTQINLAGMLLELPTVIKEIEDRNERVAAKVAQMQKAQESGEI